MMVNAPKEGRPDYFSIMAAFKVEEAWPYIIDGLHDEKWYQRNAAIQALVDIDADRALPYVYQMLEDTNYRIRRKAVFVLLELKPPGAVDPLQQVLDDEDFETRFYARQTIQFIEDNKP
jgi:HEAT repeat protein